MVLWDTRIDYLTRENKMAGITPINYYEMYSGLGNSVAQVGHDLGKTSVYYAVCSG